VAETGCWGFETCVWGFVMHVCWSKQVAGVQRRTKNKKEQKTPANTHIMHVPGCQNKYNINKPPKHAYACPRGAKEKNKQKKAPETRYAVFLVQGKKRK
jgi:hypothetical protein